MCAIKSCSFLRRFYLGILVHLTLWIFYLVFEPFVGFCKDSRGSWSRFVSADLYSGREKCVFLKLNLKVWGQFMFKNKQTKK